MSHLVQQTERGGVAIPWESLTASGLLGGFCAVSGKIVDVEDERLKVFASGARCVSLSFFVSFHDIVAGGRMWLCLSSLGRVTVSCSSCWRSPVRERGRAAARKGEI